MTTTAEKLAAEASAAGLELIGPGRKATYRTYRWLKCGHESQYKTSAVRIGEVRCQTCLDNRLQREAAAADLELIGPGRDYRYHTYRWIACGHEAEYTTGAVRKGGIRCQTCLDLNLQREASAAGLELIGPGRDSSYRTYRWIACGHEAQYQTSAVRTGQVCCQQCDATAWTKPSNIYLLHFAAEDGHEWLKLGVAKHVDGRISTYGLLNSVRLIERIATIPMTTGKDATAAEKELHSLFRPYRLSPKHQRQYMQSGATECYPVSLRDDLIDFLQLA